MVARSSRLPSSSKPFAVSSLRSALCRTAARATWASLCSRCAAR